MTTERVTLMTRALGGADQMHRVLLDGTSLIAAHELLGGEEPPTALNLWSLSLLVECLILHDELIVLDTLPNDERLLTAAQGLGSPVRVERRSVPELVDRYIEMEFPQLSHLRELSGQDLDRFQGRDSRNTGIDQAEGHLQSVLELGYSNDQGMADYLTALEEVHARQLADVEAAKSAKREEERSRLERYMRKRLPTLAFMRYGFSGDLRWGPDPPPADDGTMIGTIAGDANAVHAWEHFVERYTNAANHSTWNAGSRLRATSRHKFTPALLIRTHLYLLASEVLGAPYRPDILRAPICWKFFNQGSFAEYTIEERFVDAAERVSQERVATVNDFLGRPASASLPLFLARVFGSSKTTADIVPAALAIRDSKPAVRFREQLVRLNAAEADGDIESIVREISRYSVMLAEAYGNSQGPPDVVWSLGASAAKAAVAPSPASIIGLGADAGKSALVTSGLARRWWYRRKMALISKSIRHAKKVGAMQPQLRRLFGAELEVDELEFIDRVSKAASPPAA